MIVGRESLGLCHAKRCSCSSDAWVSCGSKGKEGRVDAGSKVVKKDIDHLALSTR